MFTTRLKYLEDCRRLLSRVKYVAEEWEWLEKPNKSNTLVAVSSLLDEQLVIIRGLVLYGRYQLADDTGFQYFHLGINMNTGFKARVCGLDVCPTDVISHRDRIHGAMSGPHFHIGDAHRRVHPDGRQHEVQELAPDFAIDNLDQWIALFKEKATVHAKDGADITAPDLGKDLFGLKLS